MTCGFVFNPLLFMKQVLQWRRPSTIVAMEGDLGLISPHLSFEGSNAIQVETKANHYDQDYDHSDNATDCNDGTAAAQGFNMAEPYITKILTKITSCNL